jgi:acyl-CoA thioester hydrolase
MSELFASYRGCTNVWECDEMGHMNVRFYVSKAAQGLGVFAGELGITPAWLRDHELELVVLDQHIRFIREFHGGADLIIYAGVLKASKDGLRIYQEFRAPDTDVISGTLISLVEIRHVDSQTPRPIPSFALKACQTHTCSIPDSAKPRSIPLEGPLPGGTKERAEELGLTPISVGPVLT